jgi:hypothetical protein
MTDSFDPNNQEHQKIKVRIKICLKHEKTALLHHSNVTKFRWHRQKLRLAMALLTSGRQENALKLSNKQVLR